MMGCHMMPEGWPLHAQPNVMVQRYGGSQTLGRCCEQHAGGVIHNGVIHNISVGTQFNHTSTGELMFGGWG